MRTLSLFFALALLGASSAGAQVQERKLVDRLLNPNLSLQNNAQNKRFNAGTAAVTTKKAPTKFFSVATRRKEKEFRGLRAFRTGNFSTATAPNTNRQANLGTRTRIATPQLSTSSSAYAGARPAIATNKKYDVSSFRGNRPFLVQGKSQKALSAQDRELTIDEVRELLNKNK